MNPKTSNLKLFGEDFNLNFKTRKEPKHTRKTNVESRKAETIIALN